MKRQHLVSGFLALLLLGNLIPDASAEVYRKSLTLGAGAIQLDNRGFGVGDTIVLTLINPHNRSLAFETTDNLGNAKSWVIPARSQATIDFTYTQPFINNVDYVVREVGGPDALIISRGTFIEVERPVSMPGVCPAPVEKMEHPVGIPLRDTPVRGLW